MLLAAGAPAVAAALPAIDVQATTMPLVNNGAHRGVTVTATCPASSRLVGGGSWLRRVSDPAVLPTNGLVLGGSVASSGASPVDVPAGGGVLDPGSWMTIANYTGVSEDGNQASTFALCASAGGPSHTAVATASVSGPAAVAMQEVAPPNLATATCAPGTRLIGGGATTSTADQVNDGTTVGNNGNLKPLGNYPSDPAGVPAADGSSSADSWSAYGSAGITNATDTVTAYALCSTDAATAPVKVARADVDGPDAQVGTTPIGATVTCPAGTRLLGGGYRVDETVDTTSGLQPQQGYHMRASRPGASLLPASDGDANPESWTALVQAGGQNLSAGKRMTNHVFAMCATQPPPADSADLTVQVSDAPDPVLVGGELVYTLTVSNSGPSAATGVALAQGLAPAATFVSSDPSAGTCSHDATTVSCALGTIASGASVTVSVKVVADSPGTLVSTVAVTSAVPDPDPSDDTATATTQANLPSRGTPTVHGQTAATAILGASIADSATLAGGDVPSGVMTFELFGPGDDACATPIASSVAAVTGNGSYASEPHTTSAPGTYRWVASYAGDGANEAATSSCGDPAQRVVVKAAPVLAVRGSPGATAGGTISATATLSGGTIVTGALTFRVYGPGDDGCSTALATSTAPVSGNGIYASPAFVASVPGAYRWVAEYAGDTSNLGAGPTACRAAAAAVAVAPATAPPGPPPGPPPGAPPAAAIAPSGAFAVAARTVDGRGRIRLRLRSPGRGRFTATATAKRGRATFRFGSRTATVGGATTVTLTIAPGAKARSELRRQSLRVSVAIGFRPTGGAARKRTTLVTVKRRAAG